MAAPLRVFDALEHDDGDLAGLDLPAVAVGFAAVKREAAYQKPLDAP